MPMTTVVIKWSGDYSYEQICDSDKSNGIYLLGGKKPYERQNQIQYCGITEDYFRNRINRKHPKLSEIKSDTLTIWLGEIIYPNEFDRNRLELAEHCFVSFWQPPLNDRKKLYYPSNSICFISQWFNRKGQPRINHPSMMKSLPDILWWDEECWRTGRLTTLC